MSKFTITCDTEAGTLDVSREGESVMDIESLSIYRDRYMEREMMEDGKVCWCVNINSKKKNEDGSMQYTMLSAEEMKSVVKSIYSQIR